MAAFILQGEHHGCQLRVAYFPADTLMADIVILTEDAQQIAVSKEYGSGTVCPDQGSFLSKVSVKTGNPRFFECAADTCFPVVCPIYVAPAGA